jgi:MFS family permease
VLEQAGLVRIVRTRQVRAMTEKYYGRVARTIVIKAQGEDAASFPMLAEALSEARVLDPADPLPMFTLRKVRISSGARRRVRRAARLPRRGVRLPAAQGRRRLRAHRRGLPDRPPHASGRALRGESVTDTGTSPGATSKVGLGVEYAKLWTASVISNLGDGIGQIAYPWLASAVTRNPVLIALVAVAQRLPWLVFTLPAGVITDRVDRRKIMVTMDAARTIVTIGVAFAVVGQSSRLPSPEDVAGGLDLPTNSTLYTILVVASLLLGFSEVLRDNAAQTILPAIVPPEGLERANGRLWGAELVANSFAGPPLGSLLIGILFALPFFVDAGTFAVAAGLAFLLTGDFRTDESGSQGRVQWRKEIGEGFGWLWHHPLLRPMAIILGLLNGLGMLSFATFVLFAQEVLEVDAFVFALLGTGAAFGGIVGSLAAPRISAKLGSGTSLYLTLIASAVTSLVIGLSSFWVVAWVMFVIGTFAAVLWNVITVSLRQTIIPDRLLGRVNSVYRFFGWGMIPIGLGIGGVIVSVAETLTTRTMALRTPWLIAAAAYAILFLYAAPRLTTEKIETARAEGIAAKRSTPGGGGEEPGQAPESP